MKHGYIVNVWIPSAVEVEADSEADAIARVKAGEGTYVDECMEGECRVLDDAEAVCVDDDHDPGCSCYDCLQAQEQLVQDRIERDLQIDPCHGKA